MATIRPRKKTKKKAKKAAKTQLTSADILKQIASLRKARDVSYEKETALLEQLDEARKQEMLTSGGVFYTVKGDIGNPDYWCSSDDIDNLVCDYDLSEIVKLQVKPVKLTKAESKMMEGVRKQYLTDCNDYDDY